jgi:hypothetical protein
MDAKTIALKGLERLRVSVEVFAADFWKLIKALGPWAIPFVLSYIVLAVIPFIFSKNVGDLTDAMNGARGIGTMTTDVSAAMRTFFIMAILGFVSFTFLSRFEGRAAALGRSFAEMLAVIILSLYLMTLGWWMLPIICLLLLPLKPIFAPVSFSRYLLVIPPIILFSAASSRVMQYAVIRAVTVGDAMTTAAAAGCLTGLVCILLLRHKAERV